MIQYSDNVSEYIAHALAPAKVLRTELNETEKKATVFVAPEQFSLAIGRSGQNVRLASELSGWNIDVQQEGGAVVAAEVKAGGDEVETADVDETVSE